MLSKEDIIVIRSLMLEFGNDEIRRLRLLLPYENAVLRGRAKEDYLVDGSSLTGLINGVDERLDSIKPFEVWDALFHFFLGRDSEDCAYPESFRLIDKNDLDGEPISHCAYEENVEMYSLPSVEQIEILKNLRVGLFNKASGNIREALPSLRLSWQQYKDDYDLFVSNAFNELTERIQAFKEKKPVTPLIVKIPTGLMLAGEESPGFHLAEALIESPLEAGSDHPLVILKDVEEINGNVTYGRGCLSVFFELGIIESTSRSYIYQRNPYILRLRELAKRRDVSEPTKEDRDSILNAPRVATKLLMSVCNEPSGMVNLVADDLYRSTIIPGLPEEVPIYKKLSPRGKKYLEAAMFHQMVTSKTLGPGSAFNELCKAIECEMNVHILPVLKNELEKNSGRKNKKKKETMSLGELARILKYDNDLLNFKPQLKKIDASKIYDFADMRAGVAHDLPRKSIMLKRKEIYTEARDFILNPIDGLLVRILAG